MCPMSMDNVIHTGRRITSTDAARYVYEDELHELCRRHGQDPNHVAWAEYDLIDAPLLCFGLYLHDETGRRYLECHPEGYFQAADDPHHCKAAMKTTETPLVGELPDWWRPGG